MLIFTARARVDVRAAGIKRVWPRVVQYRSQSAPVIVGGRSAFGYLTIRSSRDVPSSSNNG